MVVGMERFRDHFQGFEDSYVIIGGVACDEWFTREGLSFRATKDVDMVMLVEASHTKFVARFWEFIEAGKYSSQQRSSGDRAYYRFMDPKESEFPAMLELFSRVSKDLVLGEGQHVVPFPADGDISSLSAILLDDDYYQLVSSGRDVVADLSVVRPNVLIPLKAKAWLDLAGRQANGERVDSSDLKKHRNDVFRLAHILAVGDSLVVPRPVFEDLQNFLAEFPKDSIEWSAIIASVKQTIHLPMKPAELQDLLQDYFRSE